MLTGPEPVVAVEDLTYTGFRRAAALCRARVVSVQTDEEGPVVAHLEKLVREEGVQLFCTSSEVNNPTVRFTSARRRQEIAKLARRLGLHVLDDDCYSIGNHTAESYYSLLPELGWYVSSLSKALSPALRVGYVLAPKAYVPDLERTAHFSSFGLAPPLTDLALRFMEDQRLLTVAAKVRARVNDLVRVAVNHLGGYDVAWNEDVPLLWLRLPYGWRTAQFVHAAENSGVLVRSAEEFTLRDGNPPHAGLITQEFSIARVQSLYKDLCNNSPKLKEGLNLAAFIPLLLHMALHRANPKGRGARSGRPQGPPERIVADRDGPSPTAISAEDDIG